MKLKTKLTLIISVMLVMIFTVILVFVYIQSSERIKEGEITFVETLYESIRANQMTEVENLKIAVMGIANNPEVQTLFYKKDRAGLTQLLLPVYESIQTQVAQFQFHLPDSTSFLRLHKLEKYGDSLKDFRFTVNDANDKKETVAGIEEGVAGYGLT
ncbi:cache domain-containing protein [Fusibacter sp. 3D3]|uniref:cache domain-containing protein n=1 Tax=Fusibacter sp. 3D3 TaxID=1048380 RepID=UPI000855BA4E|nr:cache domain-containing protein [Fusibacter sp. 3D3]GAU76444.1 methyl-accepting chemotaxis protein [Fusibacter sp. 3D3]